jgi:hypothetical protein
VKNASILFKCKNHQRFLIQYRGKHLKGMEWMEIDTCVQALGLEIGCQNYDDMHLDGIYNVIKEIATPNLV